MDFHQKFGWNIMWAPCQAGPLGKFSAKTTPCAGLGCLGLRQHSNGYNLTVIGCNSSLQNRWYLPQGGRPGPIRNVARKRSCLTVNDSHPGTPHERTVYVADCAANPSQDFNMPDSWGLRALGSITWASDRRYSLLARDGVPMLSKVHDHTAPWLHSWFVNFWPDRHVLSANAQLHMLLALLGITYVLLFFECLLALWAFCLACLNREGGICSAYMAIAQSYASKALQQFRSSNVDKNARLRCLYNSRRVERVQYFVRPACHLMALWLLYWTLTDPKLSFQALGVFGTKQPEDPGILWVLYSTALLPSNMVLAWSLVFTFRPQLLSARMLDCSLIAFTAMWAFQVGMLPVWHHVHEMLVMQAVLQALIAGLFGNALLATPMQVTIQAVQAWKDFQGGGYIWHDLGMLAFFLFFVWLMDLQTWREAQATIKAQEADRGRAMVSRVLDSQCDAVVLLDESLCIDAAGSTQLASLMMHPSAHHASPLKGMPLTDLIMSGDVERFKEFMARELAAARTGFGVQAPIASSLQIHLRDSMHLPVPVEIFCSCSLDGGADGGGSCQFLVGMREQAGSRAVPAAPEQQPLPQLASRGGRGRADQAQQLGQIQETDMSSSQSDVSSECSTLNLERTVWIDLNTPEFTLLHWTEGFAMLFKSPPRGVGFLTMLPRRERPGFSAWLQAEAESPSPLLREINLELSEKGDGRRRGVLQRQRFTCTIVQGAEDLLASPSPQGPTVVRLDLHAINRLQPTRPSDLLAKCRARASQRTIQLWVEVQTKRILKSQHAPKSMFQEGSTLFADNTAFAAAASELFERINAEILASALVEDWQPSSIGTYTMVSGGYRVQADIEMQKWDDFWENSRMLCCLLRFCNARFLGQQDGQPSTVSV